MLWAYEYLDNNRNPTSSGGDFHIMAGVHVPTLSGDNQYDLYWRQSVCRAAIGRIPALSDPVYQYTIDACRKAGFRNYPIPGWIGRGINQRSNNGLPAGRQPSPTNGNPAWGRNGLLTFIHTAWSVQVRFNRATVQTWMDYGINRAIVRNVQGPSAMAIIWQIAMAAIRYGLSKAEIRAEIAEWLMVSGWTFEDMVFIVELIDDFFAGSGMSPSQLSAIMHVFLTEIQAGSAGHPARSVSAAVWNAIRADQPLATVKARYLEVFNAYSLWLDGLVPNGVFLTASGKIAVR
jgi:hypothetical protein